MLDEMGHCDGVIIAGGDEVVVEVTFDVLVAVFEVDVVRLVVVCLKPEVQIVFLGHSRLDHRIACVGVIVGAGGES